MVAGGRWFNPLVLGCCAKLFSMALLDWVGEAAKGDGAELVIGVIGEAE